MLAAQLEANGFTTRFPFQPSHQGRADGGTTEGAGAELGPSNLHWPGHGSGDELPEAV